MTEFNAGDVICHRQNNKKWMITKVSSGNYYLKGLDRRCYITVTVKELEFFYVMVKGTKSAKAIYGGV